MASDQKTLDFIEFAQASESKQKLKNLSSELAQLLEKKGKLDPASREAADYERELKVLSLHAIVSESLGKPAVDTKAF